MIIICLGNVGSGKTASVVREMIMSNHKKYYSNITTKSVKNNVLISPEMIIKKTTIEEGNKKPIIKKSLNIDFWKNINEPIDVVLDEAHTILNSRRSMSKTNIIITDWLALIRRVLGASTSGHGNLYMITQLPNRIDTIARDMANQVRYHKAHFTKTCKKCKLSWNENSEFPEQRYTCPGCNDHRIKIHSFLIEVRHYNNMDAYQNGFKPYKKYLIRDIENVFSKYDTLQWDNLFSEEY